MEIRPNRTETYVCSLDPMSCVDMEILSAIRRSVSAVNKNAPVVESKWGTFMYRACKRVTVKGRQPINGARYNIYGDIVGGNKYGDVKRIDVYVHDNNRIVGEY